MKPKIQIKIQSLFKIDVMKLEGLMGKYKERGADFQDIKLEN